MNLNYLCSLTINCVNYVSIPNYADFYHKYSDQMMIIWIHTSLVLITLILFILVMYVLHRHLLHIW